MVFFEHLAAQVNRRIAWSLRDREGDFSRKLTGIMKGGKVKRDQSYHSCHNPQGTLLPCGRVLAHRVLDEGP